MEWINARIESAFIGIEDHGVFAWDIQFSMGDIAQGAGLREIDAKYGLPVLKSIVTVFGPWNDLKGKLVRVGRKNRQIVAMRDILDDSKEVIF